MPTTGDVDTKLTYGNHRVSTNQSNLHNDSNQSLAFGSVKRPNESPSQVQNPNVISLAFGNTPRHRRKATLKSLRQIMTDKEIVERTGKSIALLKAQETKDEAKIAKVLAKEDAKERRKATLKSNKHVIKDRK